MFNHPVHAFLFWEICNQFLTTSLMKEKKFRLLVLDSGVFD